MMNEETIFNPKRELMLQKISEMIWLTKVRQDQQIKTALEKIFDVIAQPISKDLEDKIQEAIESLSTLLENQNRIFSQEELAFLQQANNELNHRLKALHSMNLFYARNPHLRTVIEEKQISKKKK